MHRRRRVSRKHAGQSPFAVQVAHGSRRENAAARSAAGRRKGWKAAVRSQFETKSDEMTTLRIRHNLSSNVPNALTCEYTNVVEVDQVERCRAVRVSADPFSPLQILTQDQLQYLSNADI
jgi:hypothetical protein